MDGGKEVAMNDGKDGKDRRDDKLDQLRKASEDWQGRLTDDERNALRSAMDGRAWPALLKHAYASDTDDDVQEYIVNTPNFKVYINKKGQKVFKTNPEAWWLDRYDEKDVIAHWRGLALMNTSDWHFDSAGQTLRDAYKEPKVVDYAEWERIPSSEPGCFRPADLRFHNMIFPEGQFAVIRTGGPGAGHTVGMAVTMRTSRPPTAPVLPWHKAIGNMQLAAHEFGGQWLYGVEMAVRHDYRRNGIATQIYRARFALAKRLNLRGIYAVGMLMGYHRYADRMSVEEYGARVIAGELTDPTVSLQMKRGFRAERVVRDYVDEPDAGDAGVLIVWDNPDFDGLK